MGVDVSNEMIVEAKKLGDPASDKEGGLTYITADATDQSAYMPLRQGTIHILRLQAFLTPPHLRILICGCQFNTCVFWGELRCIIIYLTPPNL